MTIDERLESVAQRLDTLIKIHIDDDREYRERFQQLTEAQERLTSAQERNARDIQDLTRGLQVLQGLVQRDGENIRALARIAELHQQRLDQMEER